MRPTSAHDGCWPSQSNAKGSFAQLSHARVKLLSFHADFALRSSLKACLWLIRTPSTPSGLSFPTRAVLCANLLCVACFPSAALRNFPFLLSSSKPSAASIPLAFCPSRSRSNASLTWMPFRWVELLKSPNSGALWLTTIVCGAPCASSTLNANATSAAGVCLYLRRSVELGPLLQVPLRLTTQPLASRQLWRP